MIKNQQIVALYEELVKGYNRVLPSGNRSRKSVLLPQLWTVETGEMTPTMKVKRKAITENNKDLIESLYHQNALR